MKRKYEIVKFEDAVAQLEFSQFYEICKIFGVEVVDRESITAAAKEIAASDKPLEASDIGNVKFRRDFDKMTLELVEKYRSFGRPQRRKIDRIVAKIVWGNKQARHLTEEQIKQSYTAGLANIEKVEEYHNNALAAETTEADE